MSHNLIKRKVSDVVDVIGVHGSVEDEDWQVEIQFYNMLNGSFEVELVRGSELTLDTISKLMIQKGLLMHTPRTFYENIVTKVAQLLAKNVQETNTSISLIHSSLGWGMWKKDLIFKGTNLYTSEGTVASTYIGTIDIDSGGNIGDYVNMIKKCVCGNEPLEAICCMAASATVIRFANSRWGLAVGNPVNHLNGNSTSGKTTAAYLFTSFGSSPEGQGSMLLSFMDTQNALLKKIGNNMGYPVSIDEFSTGGSKKFWTDFVYMLANGVGKARCTAGGSRVQQVEHFSTVFLTTGEMSLLKKCNKNEGIRARLFEFEVDNWTRSASEADRIKAVAKSNYGLITPLIAQELLKDSDGWKQCFTKWQRLIRKKIRKEQLIIGIGNRVTDIMALYLTSGEVLNKALNIRLDIGKLFGFFYTHIIYKCASDANLGVRAYSAITGYYVMNRSRFVDESYTLSLVEGDHVILPETDGYIVDIRKRTVKGKTYNRCLVFYPEVLERILLNRGFSDERIALKQVQEEGLLKTKDKSRAYDTEMIEGMRQHVYKVLIEDANYR